MQMMIAGSAVGMCAVIAWRVRETRRPLSVPAIVLPPLGMSSGFIMFLRPEFRVPFAWAALAFAMGCFVFAYPLMRTSVLTRAGNQVVLRGSPVFLILLLALSAVRLALHGYIGQFISPLQTAAIIFVLAFGMILRWRADLLRKFLALQTR
jgi:membrane protein CcdC involved in cytochrome C biogenesis